MIVQKIQFRLPYHLFKLNNCRKFSFRNLSSVPKNVYSEADLVNLKLIEKHLIWLSTYIIHNANNLRPKRDGIKVGGHQASSTSVATLITCLYFKTLKHWDRVAVKPHAQPIYQAAQYIHGAQSLEKLQKFRGKGGIQSYPSRTKDGDLIDFSTGSVGLGASITTFAGWVQEYLMSRGLIPSNIPQGERPGRMIAIVGDAELDEGNVYEALMESWKHSMKNNIIIIDYNRQSLDKVCDTNLFKQIGKMFRGTGYQVITLKYGKLQCDAFGKPGGKLLKRWLNDIDAEEFSVLTYSKNFRQKIISDFEILKNEDDTNSIRNLLSNYSDDELYKVLTNFGGHCIPTILECFAQIEENVQTCIIAYTVKGFGLPISGHRDNHGGQLNTPQVKELQKLHNIPEGNEWNKLPPEADGEIEEYIESAPYRNNLLGSEIGKSRRLDDAVLDVPVELTYRKVDTLSTQEAFGRLMTDLGRSKTELSSRIVTISPDVASSTNLSGFINLRGVFGMKEVFDVLKKNKILSTNKWEVNKSGQHFELGIAESNLFLSLAAVGMSHSIFGRRLLPIGTLYDPFISRGLDALNYGAYQDSRFLLCATPSGVSLAPEGGAHQSIYTPLIGMSQPGLTYFEPSYADELAIIMRWALVHMQKPYKAGGSVYLRLSTRPLPQLKREIKVNSKLYSNILNGAYWLKKPTEKTKVVLCYTGAIVSEVLKVVEEFNGDKDLISILAVTSSDVLYNDFLKNQESSFIYRMLNEDLKDFTDDVEETGKNEISYRLPKHGVTMITVLDGASLTLSWLGSVRGDKVFPMGVNEFGQSMDCIDIYRHFGIDSQGILNNVGRAI
ncbi:hypothetical protein HDU92_003182 [Lobulomyces angularis]|nr:hypothetical protein HDU92_003182 [Lobulomyces angularis]